ncbi:MAG TPA: DUF1835 domain-containing protein [Leeuwenhoekiella sp.]|nr:DUF1835 domain-containing protein [Leeuwenhoekiella sp.]
MSTKILHITNGDSLTERLKNIDLEGEIVVWREMLCEGPTVSQIGNEYFLDLRKKFLQEEYNVSEELYEKEFVSQLKKLDAIDSYDEIILWFEFDLFCHINMLAAISYLLQQKKKEPLYLVCSGRVPGEKELIGLSELSDKQLMSHYKTKIKLSEDDLDMAHFIWQLYCGSDPNKLKPEIRKSSNFKYLSSCIRAHIERYPNVNTGLNALETNVLRLIEQEHITSEHQLCGYALSYQGYYGYSDTMILKIIDKLRPFFQQGKDGLELNMNGQFVLDGKHNFYRDVKNEEFYGGTKKYDFLYSPENHQLLKL